jgi:Ner family transcriptional regulator
MKKVDWHVEDIKSELHKRKTSLRALSIAAGLSPTTLNNVLRIPYPKAEKIVAEAIGEKPENIWPSRYQYK